MSTVSSLSNTALLGLQNYGKAADNSNIYGDLLSNTKSKNNSTDTSTSSNNGGNSFARSDFENQLEELNKYIADRDTQYKKENGDKPPLNGMQEALPYVPGLGIPFVNASQQKTLDDIHAKYAGKEDISGLMEDLTKAGVNPYQLASKADYYFQPGGNVVDKNGNPVGLNRTDITA